MVSIDFISRDKGFYPHLEGDLEGVCVRSYGKFS